MGGPGAGVGEGAAERHYVVFVDVRAIELQPGDPRGHGIDEFDAGELDGLAAGAQGAVAASAAGVGGVGDVGRRAGAEADAVGAAAVDGQGHAGEGGQDADRVDAPARVDGDAGQGAGGVLRHLAIEDDLDPARAGAVDGDTVVEAGGELVAVEEGAGAADGDPLQSLDGLGQGLHGGDVGLALGADPVDDELV